ncbi:hypothetical protein MRX96_024865 [Rhipicephalus microplus]
MCNLQTQLPELWLIHYDCGKLQVLDKLLWQLREGQHRVLIFTEMTRMLDVLKQPSWNTSTPTGELSVSSCPLGQGGIGVNLTGADTVVFYNSHWNPTMDAQAQDRCHRIGQTRDIHIYRLISGRTIEENILKKANQKRMLGDLAIEGGDFTTAFLKLNTFKDLFGTDFDLAIAEKGEEAVREDRPADSERTEKFSSVEFEKCPLLRLSKRQNLQETEEQLNKLMYQLMPVERYAMRFLEYLQEPLTFEQLKQAEDEIEAQKKDWELGRLKAIEEEEERRTGYRDDEEAPALVYSSEDAYTLVPKSGREWRSSCGGSGGVGGAKSGAVAARQVNGTAATPKRVSERREAAAVSTTDKVPQNQKETIVPPPTKSEHCLLCTITVITSCCHQYSERRHTNVPGTSWAQPLAKRYILPRQEKGDRTVAAIKPLATITPDKARTADRNIRPPPSVDKVQVGDKNVSATKLQPPPATNRIKLLDRNASAIKPPPHSTTEKIARGEKDLSVKRTLSVTKVLAASLAEKSNVPTEVVFPPASKAHMLDKGLRTGSKGTMPTKRVRVSEPVGNHFGDVPITEKTHTSNSPSRTKVQPPYSFGGSPTVLKPFSNSNLVIRTRRALVAETNSEAVTPTVIN